MVNPTLQDSCEIFIPSLMSVFPYNEMLIDAYVDIMCRLTEKELLGLFRQFVLPHSKKIEAKDSAIFIGDLNLFGKYSNEVKKIWLNKDLDDDNREIIWNWAQTFVKIATPSKILEPPPEIKN